MLCIVGVKGMPKMRRQEDAPPQRSFAHRMQEFKKRRRESGRKKTFDFSGA
jgi:hypothetical protein